MTLLCSRRCQLCWVCTQRLQETQPAGTPYAAGVVRSSYGSQISRQLKPSRRGKRIMAASITASHVRGLQLAFEEVQLLSRVGAIGGRSLAVLQAESRAGEWN